VIDDNCLLKHGGEVFIRTNHPSKTNT